ncbi:hypothetical protein Q0Z83_062160 [Actinoplanes sichuanensis]|uniref:Uncharacterized protein n=1 Tax=Actinoplanes sichuanensis TaxID=512349 RepID=A0ABW4A064_9ACTN|nr:hypothetical protein [Actinoplanes sichuanensis]BEL08025.1 hypothetical protein Q0Z83_062160 [Actinoplanes sichuanensis]
MIDDELAGLLDDPGANLDEIWDAIFPQGALSAGHRRGRADPRCGRPDRLGPAS